LGKIYGEKQQSQIPSGTRRRKVESLRLLQKEGKVKFQVFQESSTGVGAVRKGKNGRVPRLVTTA